jgi:uncharacterized protein
MNREAVFLDTSAMIALAVDTDSLHDAAIEVMRELDRKRSPMVTSDFVLVEFLNASASASRRTTAASLARGLLTSPTLEFVECSRAAVLEALALYESRPDKDWSLVDCSSMVICKERGIRRVFTHDRHFRQAGLGILL